jgi:hypothetical protein
VFAFVCFEARLTNKPGWRMTFEIHLFGKVDFGLFTSSGLQNAQKPFSPKQKLPFLRGLD